MLKGGGYSAIMLISMAINKYELTILISVANSGLPCFDMDKQYYLLVIMFHFELNKTINKTMVESNKLCYACGLYK